MENDNKYMVKHILPKICFNSNCVVRPAKC